MIKLSLIFEHAVNNLLKGYPNGTHANLVLRNPALYTEHFSTGLVRVENMSVHLLLDRLAAALASDDHIELSDTDFVLMITPPPTAREHRAQPQVQGNRRGRHTRKRRAFNGMRYGSWLKGVLNREKPFSTWIKDHWKGLHDPTSSYSYWRGKSQLAEAANLCAPMSIVDGIKWVELSPDPNEEEELGEACDEQEEEVVDEEQAELKKQLKERSKAWKKWLKSGSGFYRRIQDAKDLVHQAAQRLEQEGIHVEEEGPFCEEAIFTMCEIAAEEHPEINFHIFTEPAPPIFSTENDDVGKNVDLLFLDRRAQRQPYVFYDHLPEDERYVNHCLLIRDLKCYFGGAQTCRLCWRACTKKHLCDHASCRLCCRPACENKETEESDSAKSCDTCLKWFKSNHCYHTHLGLNLCTPSDVCPSCLNKMMPDHVCSIKMCSRCGVAHLPWNPCYLTGHEDDEEAYLRFLQSRNGEPPPAPAQTTEEGEEEEEVEGEGEGEEEEIQPPEDFLGNIWSADIECSVDPVTGEHVPVLIMACKDRWFGKKGCKKMWKVWSGKNCIYDFIDEIVSKPKKEANIHFKDAKIFFHNVTKIYFLNKIRKKRTN